jgi:phage terminase large subunit-like protein
MAEVVITTYDRHGANMVVGESNNDGDLVERCIKAVNAEITLRLVHASRRKATWEEPTSLFTSKARFIISVHSHSLKTRCVNEFHE